MVYCENCNKEELKNYIEDSLGSIFCNDSCFSNSLEYRNLNSNQVSIIKEVSN